MFALTLTLCLLTYLALTWGEIPRLRLDRAGIAIVGATLLLASGAMTFAQASSAIDGGTMALLFGMMVVVAGLRISGFFETVAHWTLEQVTSPVALLAVIIATGGILSAFLVNDVICLAMTPLVLQLAHRRQLSPVPYLVALATSSNIGSVGTIIGNPQNMIIGSLSDIGFARFAGKLLPVALVGLLLNFGVIYAIYGKALNATGPVYVPAVRHAHKSRIFAKLRRWSVAVTITAAIAFFSGVPVTIVALAAAAVTLLAFGRLKPQRLYKEVDWGLLVMFCGLFAVTNAFERNVISHWNLAEWQMLARDPLGTLGLVCAGLSQVVSNVPAVLLLKPTVSVIAPELQESAWLTLAAWSTLAGNLTLLGSVANLIVVEIARKRGVSVGIWDYCKIGIPVTIVTLATAYAWLAFVNY